MHYTGIDYAHCLGYVLISQLTVINILLTDLEQTERFHR